MAKATAYVEGLNSLRRLLKPIDELVAAPWKKAMETLAQAGAEGGQAGAPVAGGLLRTKIQGRVQKGPLPMWAAVRSRAKRKSKSYPRGFDYPRMLEFSAKHGHVGWFQRSVSPRLSGQAEAALAQAGDEIAAIWGTQTPGED